MISSPNTVLANSLDHAIDLLRPRIEISKPKKIVFAVGTQINGIPHIGTYIVQASSFVLARKIRGRFGIPCEVSFGALENAPFDVVKGVDGTSYQRAYGHALGKKELQDLLRVYYLNFFDRLSELTGIGYHWQTYAEQQSTPTFRSIFLNTLEVIEQLRWCVAPSNGVLRVRLPNEQDGFYAQKYAEDTVLKSLDADKATFGAKNRNGQSYEVLVTRGGEDGTYLDLNTLYRNVVKEAVFAEENETLAVMMKGGDWTMSTQPVDWALGLLGYTSIQLPMRLFTPQVVTDTGAKLSKSLIREGDISMSEVPEWLLDMGRFAEFNPDYPQKMIWLIEQFLSHPRHFYRAYTYAEVVRIFKEYKKLGEEYEQE